MRWGNDGRLYLDDWAQNRIWVMEARLCGAAQLAVEDAALVEVVPLPAPAADQSDGWNSNPVVSDDGRIILFASTADNLVPGDTNRQQDIFLYNRDTRQMERVSLSN
jgi:hypothetical protein